MVTVCEVIKRKNKEGVEFNALILQGGIELVKSRETGSWYATSKRASITSTFDDATAQSLIGTQIPGSIKRVETEPYDFVVKDTGEVLELTHRWQYDKEGETIEEKVIADSKVVMPEKVAKPEKLLRPEKARVPFL
jgi:hypothetical protein